MKWTFSRFPLPLPLRLGGGRESALPIPLLLPARRFRGAAAGLLPRFRGSAAGQRRLRRSFLTIQRREKWRKGEGARQRRRREEEMMKPASSLEEKRREIGLAY